MSTFLPTDVVVVVQFQRQDVQIWRFLRRFLRRHVSHALFADKQDRAKDRSSCQLLVIRKYLRTYLPIYLLSYLRIYLLTYLHKRAYLRRKLEF